MVEPDVESAGLNEAEVQRRTMHSKLPDDLKSKKAILLKPQVCSSREPGDEMLSSLLCRRAIAQSPCLGIVRIERSFVC